MKGPVPLALKDAKPSSLFLKSMGLLALFLSLQTLLMICSTEMCPRKTGFTSFSLNSTVRSSIFVGSPTALAYTLMSDVPSRARSTENTTSSAVYGVPS